MAPDELNRAFTALTRERQAYFLAITMLNLTVSLRDPGFYQANGSSAGSKQAQGINELMHTIAGHLAALLSPSEAGRRPDDVFCEVLAEKAAIWDCAWFLSDATERALKAIT